MKHGSFSGLGAGESVLVHPGESFAYALRVALGDTFDGTVELQSSRSGETWSPAASAAGGLLRWTGAYTYPRITMGVLVNETARAQHYRFACVSYAGDPAWWVLTPRASDRVEVVLRDKAGAPLVYKRDDGSIDFAGATTEVERERKAGGLETFIRDGLTLGLAESIGLTWTALGEPGPSDGIYEFAYCGNGVVVAASCTPGSIFRSTDYGATWSDLGQQHGAVSIYAVKYLGANKLVAVTGDGGKVIRSVNAGAAWTDEGQLGANTQVQAVENCGNGIVVAIASPAGAVYRSTNYGDTWSLIGTLEPESAVYDLVYLGNGIILGAGEGGLIVRSTDYGLTWRRIAHGAGELQGFTPVNLYCFANLGGGSVLLGGSEYYAKATPLLRSDDYGITWDVVSTLPGSTATGATVITSLSYLGNGLVMAGSFDGIEARNCRSLDYGRTWEDLGALGTEVEIMSYVGLPNGVVLAGGYGPIFRSVPY